MMALKAGIDVKKIVFSGVGKTSNEIDYAIKILKKHVSWENSLSRIIEFNHLLLRVLEELKL